MFTRLPPSWIQYWNHIKHLSVNSIYKQNWFSRKYLQLFFLSYRSSQADDAQRDNLTLDFHYQSANLVKYRTDITFGWLDLMVSFGGIAGLFLGCSILSAVEIFYYFFVILIFALRKFKKFIRVNSRVHDIHTRKQKNVVQTVKVISLTDIDMKANKARY